MNPTDLPGFPSQPPTQPPYGSAAGLPEPPPFTPPPSAPTATPRRRGLRYHLARRLIIVAVVIAAVAIIGHRAGSDNSATSLDRLQVGDCFNTPSSTKFTGITVISCTKPHTGEVYAVGTAQTKIDVTQDASNDPEVVRICRTEVPADIGDAIAGAQAFDSASESFFVDSSAKGRLICVVTTEPRTGSYVTPTS